MEQITLEEQLHKTNNKRLTLTFKNKTMSAENMRSLAAIFNLSIKETGRMIKNLVENGALEINFNIIQEAKKDRSFEQAKEVFKFFNLKCGTNFSDRGIENLVKIQARIDEYGVDACKTVICRKSLQWKDHDIMKKYLRPITIFGKEKFQNYLGENV